MSPSFVGVDVRLNMDDFKPRWSYIYAMEALPKLFAGSWRRPEKLLLLMAAFNRNQRVMSSTPKPNFSAIKKPAKTTQICRRAPPMKVNR